MLPATAATGTVQLGAIANPVDHSWYRRWAGLAEDAGFALLSTGDSQSLWSDPFVTLTVGALTSRSARLAITVSNPRTRHPAVAASSLAALSQLTGGRVVFGLGSGDSALRNIGLRAASVAEVGEYARAVKRLCAGEEITWQGAAARVRWARCDVPVWVAAEGPRMQLLAGQIADGVLLSNALHPDVLDGALAQVAAGAQAAGRSVADIEVWCMAAMCFAETEDAAIRRLHAILAGTANHVYRSGTATKGVPPELEGALKELRERYDSRHHASPATAGHNARLVEELGLVPFLARRSVIAGPPDRCVQRIGELAGLGVRNILIHHQANDPVEFMETFRDGVTPYVSLAPPPGPVRRESGPAGPGARA
jgi:alkanesulfonate monooxygenase SsuD/methylene tetrahydromethanopterin reductase-like flavin-dependent oxidoreductase (luciferase family)